MVTQADVQGWADGLDGVVDRIAARFGRAEPRRRARAYLRGLLAPVERKNGWQLAEAVGDATPDGVQDFLSRVQWDADAVRDDLQAYVVQHLGDPDSAQALPDNRHSPAHPAVFRISPSTGYGRLCHARSRYGHGDPPARD